MDNLPSTQFDLVVIGAGINGAGIARDAAMRGLKVLLLDKGDLGGGTTSFSTRLIHGGLRYLEHGEFGLVRESLRERETLMRIAPHLIRPLPILVPIYKGSRRGTSKIRAGMVLYDLLSTGKSLPRHRMLSPLQTMKEAPALQAEGLRGAAVYYDAQVEFAERLVVENALSAMEHGAEIATYATVTKLLLEQDHICGVEFEDQSGVTKTAKARVVINAAGPWVDHLLDESPVGSERLVGGTKGSHLIVPGFDGAPSVALYVEAQTDQRPFFIIPWNGQYLIGTTDIRFEGDPAGARINEEETTYLLRETNRIFPSAQLTRADVNYSYSGVRPLPYVRNKQEESITRRHFVRPHGQIENLWSIVGGKLTTYRSLAEEVVDKVVSRLGCASNACETATTPLPGAVDSSDDLAPSTVVENQRTIDHLRRVYGSRMIEVLKLAHETPSLAEIFDEESGAIAAEIVFAFKRELAQTLADCLLRRTMVGLNSTCGLNAVASAARIAMKHLGWSDERRRSEEDAYREFIKKYLVGLSLPVSK